MGTPFLDLKALREAVEDTAVVVEILGTFRADALARLGDLQQACGARELKGVGREAHALKGMALSVGAMALAQGCLQIEGAAKASDWTALTTHVDTLMSAWKETLRELDRELAQAAA